MRQARRGGALVNAWFLAALLAFVGLYALGYLISPFGPSCVSGRPGVPFRPTLPLWVVMAGAPALATLFVGLYVALGVSNLLRRLVAIVVVLVATFAAGMVGLVFTPMCT